MPSKSQKSVKMTHTFVLNFNTRPQLTHELYVERAHRFIIYTKTHMNVLNWHITRQMTHVTHDPYVKTTQQFLQWTQGCVVFESRIQSKAREYRLTVSSTFS